LSLCLAQAVATMRRMAGASCTTLFGLSAPKSEVSRRCVISLTEMAPAGAAASTGRTTYGVHGESHEAASIRELRRVCRGAEGRQCAQDQQRMGASRDHREDH